MNITDKPPRIGVVGKDALYDLKRPSEKEVENPPESILTKIIAFIDSKLGGDVNQERRNLLGGLAVGVGVRGILSGTSGVLISAVTSMEGAQDQRDKDSPDYLYKERPPVTYNGNTISQLSVQHQPETFHQHYSQFREKISQSDYIVLEYLPTEFIGLAKPGMSEEVIVKSIEATNGVGTPESMTDIYYVLLWKLCAELGKTVLIANSESFPGQVADLVTTGMGPVILAENAFRLWQASHEKSNTVSRKGLIRGIIEFAMVARSTQKIASRAGLLEKDGQRSSLHHSIIEERDVRKAHELRKLIDDDNLSGLNFLLIEGSAHLTLNYFTDEEEFIKKLDQYGRSTNPIMHSRPQRADFDTVNNKWNLIKLEFVKNSNSTSSSTPSPKYLNSQQTHVFET